MRRHLIFVFLINCVAPNLYAQENSLDNNEDLIENIPIPNPEVNSNGLNLVTLGSKQYLFVISLATWFEALTYCNALAMDLASVENEKENEMLKQHINTLGLPSDHTTTFWLSGNILGRSKWTWMNGAPVDFSDWGPGEPNNPSNEHCISYHYISGQKIHWNDAACTLTRNGNFWTAFICERSIE